MRPKPAGQDADDRASEEELEAVKLAGRNDLVGVGLAVTRWLPDEAHRRA